MLVETGQRGTENTGDVLLVSFCSCGISFSWRERLKKNLLSVRRDGQVTSLKKTEKF